VLNQQVWLDTPQDIRNKLIKEFGLVLDCSKSVENLPFGARVTSDGYSPRELMKITVERLQTYVGSNETDFYKLWNMAIEKNERPTVSSFTDKVEKKTKYPIQNKRVKKS
jgi:hypothetical protein